MRSAVTIDYVMKRPRLYNIRTAHGVSARGLKQDLRSRLEKDNPWHWAVIEGKVKKSDTQGMLLLRPERGRVNAYEGLYYPNANCGSRDRTVLLTAEALPVLGVKTPVFRLFSHYLAPNPHVWISGIETRSPVVEKFDV